MYIASNGVKTAVIVRDTDPRSPREDDNISKMVCWHNRYNLGDTHSYSQPRDFAVDMVNKHLSIKDVMTAISNGELSDFRLTGECENGVKVVEANTCIIPGKQEWERMNWGISEESGDLVESSEASFDLEDDILDYCYEQEMLRMCEKYGDIAILPLYLYDHSGISMSTGSFVGRAHHAEWDSGQVGFIYMDKKTAMENMAMECDTLNIAKMIPENIRDTHEFMKAPNVSMDSVLEKMGFTPVTNPRNINNLFSSETNQALIDESLISMGFVFKKDNYLYVLEPQADPDKFKMTQICSYNADLQSLTEDSWKARAEEFMKGDVDAYDAYLQGEVYGYEIYEGTSLEDSCWGFNPGSGDIQKLMNEELRWWFGGKLDFEDSDDSHFDIDSYFFDHDFPELRGEIRKLVEAHLHQQKEPFPYGVSYEDIARNKDGVLDNVIEALYDEHCIPDTKAIHAAFQEHAGISRDHQPKLTVSDLDPNKDYTADELISILEKKPSLDNLISGASSRVGKKTEPTPGKEIPQERA